MAAGDKGSLIKDPGWHEYILEIENRGAGLLTIHTVEILSPNGRYLKGATTYEQITARPFEPDTEDPLTRIRRNLGI